MKAIEQYFPVVQFIMLYKVLLTLESVDDILKCDHSNEGYRAVRTVLSLCTVIHYLMLLIMLYCKVVLTFHFLNCDLQVISFSILRF